MLGVCSGRVCLHVCVCECVRVRETRTNDELTRNPNCGHQGLM